MTSTGIVEVPTRPDLEIRLERGIGKWKKRGYNIEKVKVACIDDVQKAIHE